MDIHNCELNAASMHSAHLANASRSDVKIFKMTFGKGLEPFHFLTSPQVRIFLRVPKPDSEKNQRTYGGDLKSPRTWRLLMSLFCFLKCHVQLEREKFTLE